MFLSVSCHPTQPDVFKLVLHVQSNIAGYPWPVTAPLGLYPEYPLDALPHVDYEVRKAITDSLFKYASSCCSETVLSMVRQAIFRK